MSAYGVNDHEWCGRQNGIRGAAFKLRWRIPSVNQAMRLALAALLLALAAIFAAAGTASAQGAVDVRSSSAQSDFPDGIVFALDAASDAGFDDVRLVYEVAPDGVRATAVPDCAGGTVVSCTFVLAANRQNLLIPGAEVTYFWRLTTGGATQETEPQLVTYEDDRFEWRTVSEGNLTLWWYDGSEEEARAVLAAGRESLDRIGSLLQTTVDFPVKVFYYGSAQDMQRAIIADNSEGIVTLGEVVYSDTAMVSADTVPTEIARHEIAHIVVRQALRGPFDVPDWLNEGTAVFAQSQPLEGQRQALEQAISSGQVLSVRSLSSASVGAQSSRVFLFYGQSWSLVQFLVDTYGEEKFAQLFKTFKDGATTAEALQQVYGFDQDGLENAWRESVGLPPREPVSPDEVGEEPTPNPTADDTPEPDDDGGVSIAVIAVIAVLTMVLAGGLLATGVMLARRYR